MPKKTIGRSQLRSFGFIVAAGFALIALFPLIRNDPPRGWALILSLALSATALIVPSALGPFHRLWMTAGEGLGWVNTRIILSAVYYIVIVPIGAVRRVSTQDPMRRKREPDAYTYRATRGRRPASHMHRQY